MRIIHALWVTLLMALMPSVALAESFLCISNSNNCSATPSLSWTFSGSSLTITNNGVEGSFISSVYFDNASGMSVLGVTGWTGAAVSFRKASAISETILPAGFPVGFISDVSWTAEGDTDSKKQFNGVGAGESITFGLAGVSAKNLANGTARVGVHLKGLTDAMGASTSISMVTAVPKSETYAMLLASLFGGLAGGLVLIGAVVRRRGLSAKHE